MNVLVIGSGAVEHALVWKLVQSERVNKVYCAPGNPGIDQIAHCVDIKQDDLPALLEFALENQIELTVVGSERPLALGITNLFSQNGLNIFGPEAKATKLCSSRSFAKKFLYKNKIPTPRFGIYDKENAALEYAKKSKYPLVVKYDSNIYQVSSFICETFDEAKKAIEKCFDNLSKNVVIEDFIYGKTISFPVITDGYNAVPLVSSTVYKQSMDGDGGFNTKGVGAFAPSSVADLELEEKIANKIIFPAIDALTREKMGYCGILNVEMIIDKNNNPYVLEFGSNLGNPQAQTILPLIEDDLYNVMMSTVIGALGDEYEFLNINDDHAVTVVLLSGNYPISIKKGAVIEGFEDVYDDDVYLFHNETKKNKYCEILTDGGRPLSITATASTLSRAHERVYESLEMINYKDIKYRKDIVKNSINCEKAFL